MNTPTARLQGIVVKHGAQRTLDGVDLELRPGVTGLLGPNGAGKTTLLRLLATVSAPAGGTVELFGTTTETSAGRIRARRRLGYMPQEPGFHQRFTLFEFIDYVAILKEYADRAVRHDEVRRVVELVGLTDKLHARIRTLSGGMRRRLALAQALLGNPDLLVLDEPTAGLDPELRMWFRDLVSRLGADRTVLLSTHQTEDVSAVCSQVIVLGDGRTRFSGSPAELADLATGHTWIAEERDPAARAAIRGVDGRHRHIGNAPPGAELVPPTIEDGYLLLLDAPEAAAVLS